MSDDGTRTGFGYGLGDRTKTSAPQKLQVKMPSGKIYGPYTKIEVLGFIQDRRISGEEEVLFEGEPNWRPIASDTDFFDALEARLAPQKAKKEKTQSAQKKPVELESIKSQLSLSQKGESSPTSAPPKTSHDPEKTRALGRVVDDVKRPNPATQAQIKNSEALPTPKTYQDSGQVQTPTTKRKPKRRNVLAAPLAIIAIAAASYFFLAKSAIQTIDVTKLGPFKSRLWYGRPLELALERASFLVPTVPEAVTPDSASLAPKGFGAIFWSNDLSDLIKNSNDTSKGSFWFRWVWNTAWLGQCVEVIDKARGEALKSNALAILSQLNEKKVFGPQQLVMLNAALGFGAKAVEASVADLQAASGDEMSQWLSEELSWLDFWDAGARGKTFARLGPEYSSDDLELAATVRHSLLNKDMNGLGDAVLELATLDPQSIYLWMSTAEMNWRFQKGKVQLANSLFMTGLTTLSLYPSTMQRVYWRQYAEFLLAYGRQATSDKALKNVELIAKGNLNGVQPGLFWDLNQEELDVIKLAESVLARASSGVLEPSELATLFTTAFVFQEGARYAKTVAEHYGFESQWTRAVSLYERILLVDPQNADALSGLVWAHSNLFQFEKAFKIYDQLVASPSVKAQASKVMGVLTMIGQDFDGADKNLSQYVAAKPTDAWGHYFLAKLRLEQENNLECLKAANLAVLHASGELKFRSKLLGYHCRMLAKLDQKGAIAELRDWVQKESTNIPVRIALVDALLVADLTDQALIAAREGLERFKRSFSLRMKLGEVYQKTGDFDRAVAFYGRASKDRPGSAEPFVRIAKIFEDQKNFSAAADNFETAMRVEPDYPEVYLFAARAYRKAGNEQRAAAFYGKEIGVRPAVIATFIEAADFLLEKNAPQEVPKLFQSFADDFQGDPRVLTRLAQAYLAMQDYQNAQSTAATAINANPNLPEPNRVLGYIYDRQGEYDAAKEAFESYLKLAPGAPDASEIRSKISKSPYR
jgi:tetratricopeptide (TPR) repeat protein